MPPEFNWIQFLATLGAILTGLFGVYLSYRMNKKILLKKGLEDEQKEIYKKLNEFYGPLGLLRGKSERIYRIFSERFKKEDPEFRTLNHIMLNDGSAFTEDEHALMKQILEIGAKVEDLVVTRSGLIDDPELSSQLSRLLAHTAILKLAYEGHIKGDPTKFDKATFPRDLDKFISKKIEQLKHRLEEIKKM